MTTPKASGPLWAVTSHRGEILTPLMVSQVAQYDTPCRLIPGHGKVVPVELVEAIDNWYVENGCTGSRFGVLKKLIDAALEGAV